MKALIALLVLVGFSSVTYAECSKWEKIDGVTATLHNGDDGVRWERTCDDTRVCKLLPGNNQLAGECDATEIIMKPKEDPNKLASDCTNWELDGSIDCKPGKFWYRSCQILGPDIKTEVCSDTKPE